MAPPLISIIIPAYQRENVIPRAIRSVLSQTFLDFELIIVDDHSTDNTRAIVEKFIESDPRVKYIFLESNQGPACARNAGVKSSQGEYIAFLDSDDEWYPSKLEKQVGILQQFPEIDVVFTDSLNNNEENGKTNLLSEVNGDFLRELQPRLLHGYQHVYLFDGPFRKVVYKKCFILISTVALRRSCYDRIGGFNPARFGTEDIDLFTRLAEYSKFVFLDQAQVTRYQNNKGISAGNDRWLNEQINYHSMCLNSTEYEDLRTTARQNLLKAYQNRISIHGLNWQPLRATRCFLESLRIGFTVKLLLITFASFLGPIPFKFIRPFYLWKKRVIRKKNRTALVSCKDAD